MFDFETGFVLDGKLGRLFTTDRSFITYERRFRSRCTGSDDIAAGFHRRKNKRGWRFHFLRRDFGKLIGVAIAINERCELLLRYFRRDVEKIDMRCDALDFRVILIDRVDADIDPFGLPGLFVRAHAEPRFRRKKRRHVTAYDRLAIERSDFGAPGNIRAANCGVVFEWRLAREIGEAVLIKFGVAFDCLGFLALWIETRSDLGE